MADGKPTATASASPTLRAASSRTASIRRATTNTSAESVEHDSFLKSPYYPLARLPERELIASARWARLNVCDHIGLPLADKELIGISTSAAGNGSTRLTCLSLRPADRHPGRHGIHRAAPDRSRHARNASAGRGWHQPSRSGRRERGTARHTLPPLSGWKRERPAEEDQPYHRHRAEQPGDESHDYSDRPTIHSRKQDPWRRTEC